MVFMDFLDYMDWGGLFASLLGSLFGILLVLLAGLAAGILWCIFKARALNNIGEKLGHGRSWKVYVPIANTLYFLQVAEAPWWYIFLMGQGGVAVYLLLNWLSLIPFIGMLFRIIALVYPIVFVVFTVKAYFAYYDRLGFSRMLALPRILPGFSVIASVVDCLIAYTPLLDSQQASSVPAPVPAPGGCGHIRGLAGVYANAVFDLAEGQKITFGRDSASSNVVFDPANTDISRLHCTVEYAGGMYYVTDHSRNGTFTGDGARLAAGVSSPLPKGTVIYLGNPQNRDRKSVV